MSRGPEARRIKRIGLAIEFEDGGRIMVYADDLKSTEVTVTTETPKLRSWQDSGYIWGVPRASILIEGLETYRVYEEAARGVTDLQLDAIRREVTP